MSKEQLLTINQQALEWWKNQTKVGKVLSIAFYFGVSNITAESVTMGQVAQMYEKDKNFR